jgi:hypothetical protein
MSLAFSPRRIFVFPIASTLTKERCEFDEILRAAIDVPVKITGSLPRFLIYSEELSTLVGDRDVEDQELENFKIPYRSLSPGSFGVANWTCSD